jgi:lipopolysaccharide transport system permease protein
MESSTLNRIELKTDSEQGRSDINVLSNDSFQPTTVCFHTATDGSRFAQAIFRRENREPRSCACPADNLLGSMKIAASEPNAVNQQASRRAVLVSETVIRPASGWEILQIAELWRYRDLLLMLTWRDISVRYKQTVLGVAWAILQPTATMIVFSGVFGRLADLPSGGEPYPLFVFSGLLPWMFFSTAVTNAAHSVVENERLVTKVYFPRLAIPLAAVGAALVDFCMACTVLLLLMLVYGMMPGWNALYLPVVLLLLIMAAAGVGAFLSALNVAYRDFRYVVGFLIQLWMFGTPTIYMEYVAYQQPAASQALHAASLAGEAGPPVSDSVWAIARHLVNLNPMTTLIALFRAATLGGSISWFELGSAAVGSVFFFLGGLLYFRRVEDSFADVI